MTNSVHAPFCKLRLNRWTVSYLLEENHPEIDFSSSHNVEELIEELCVYTERTLSLQITRGRPVDVLGALIDNFKSRFLYKLMQS